VKFLVDAQLPPALARWLCEAGYDAAHVGILARSLGVLEESPNFIMSAAQVENEFVALALEDKAETEATATFHKGGNSTQAESRM
jgi:predicted nuclease of predicted toxin-antitoxin system